MLGVFALGSAFHDSVVNVNFHSSIDQGLEDLCHQFLISSTSILEPEQHDFVAIQPVWCHEGCLFFIRLEHGDLVVYRESVYQGEHFVSDSGVNYLIYPR